MVLGAAMLTLLTALAPARLAAELITVCSSGCDATTIQDAVDGASAGDVVRLNAATHTESEIVVSASVTIESGPGEAVLQASEQPGTLTGRILSVPSGATVVIRDLGLRNGSLVANTAKGGGIHNEGHLTLDRVVLYQNDTQAGGGAIYNGGFLRLLGSLVRDNESASDGGGILNAAGATLVAVRTLMRRNTTAAGGGNLYNAGTAILSRSAIQEGEAFLGGGAYNTGSLTFSGLFFENQADHGGAIVQSGGFLSVRNSSIEVNTALGLGGGASITGGEAVFADTTFSSNNAVNGGALHHSSPIPLILHNTTLSSNVAARDGGGIYVAEGMSVQVASSTIASNSSDIDENGDGDGGGIYLEPCTGICPASGGDALAHLRNTILARNEDRSVLGPFFRDCKGELTSEGYNLVEDGGTLLLDPCRVIGDLTGVVLGVDPMLGALTDNGGTPAYPGGDPPRTRFLITGSPAIDQGNPAGCTDPEGMPLHRDQRGAGRVGICDLGSFEAFGVPAEGIFADGFESGNTILWSGL